MKALVTGGTGFVGPRLLRLLNQPTVLSRNPARAAESIGHLAGNILPWQPLEGPPPPEAFEGVDVVFHLAGESVAEGRWTRTQKEKNQREPGCWHASSRHRHDSSGNGPENADFSQCRRLLRESWR